MLRALLIAIAVVAVTSIAATTLHGTSAAFTDSQTIHLDVSSGGLSIERDGAGLVFSSTVLAPGDTATASVKVTNGGTLPYDLTLRRELVDAAAPGGCAIRDALTLKIVEIAAGGTRRTLTDGPLTSAATEVALGAFAVGAARTYEMTVAFPAGHGATATDNDNCFQGSFDRERFSWAAEERPS
jgi:hypothetical protein